MYLIEPLKKIVKSPVLFVNHLVGRGVDLFQAVCQRDLEGIVAKAAQGLYQPDWTTWVKIENPNYSQAAGHKDFFDVRRKPASRFGKSPLSLGGNVNDNWKTSRRSHAQHKKGETETSARKELVWDRRNVTGSED